MLILVWPVAWWALSDRDPSRAETLSGIALVCGAATMRLASLRILGRGARVHRAGMRGELATAGPYRFTRNPLYVAAGLAVTGLGLVAGGGWVAWLLLPATFAVYTPVVLSEERALRAADPASFGAYDAAVPRWLGRWRRRTAAAIDRAPWNEILRREIRLIPGLAAAVIGILLVRSGALPIREVLAMLPVPSGALLTMGLAIGGLGNSGAIEWKRWRRHGERHAKVGTAPGRAAVVAPLRLSRDSRSPRIP